MLKKAADVCETEDFKTEYSKRLEDGEGAAFAYLDCIEKRTGKKFLSNDLLGISYIRAIKKLNAYMCAVTVSRLGADYNEESICDEGFQSATALRGIISNKNYECLEKHIPKEMLDIICREEKNGLLTDISEIESLILGYFRLNGDKDFNDIAECGGGIANRICDVAKSEATLEKMLEALKTKRYTDAKLRRALLYCLTDVKKEHLCALPEYTTLLASNDTGRELLALNRKSKTIDVVTKPADVPRESFQFSLSEKLDSVYLLSRKNKQSMDFFFKKRAFIETK